MTAQSFLAYYKIINGGLTVGDFVVIQMYQGQLIGPLRMLAGFYTRLTMNWIDVEIVLELLKTEESITEVENPIAADI
jgi:ABC-type bacteriocin/lantibiotic exporter with double-glycine peptidase domain